MIPLAGWHRVTWERADVRYAVSQFALSLRAELGYLYFWSRAFSTRLYSKATSMPVEFWNAALSQVDPTTPKVQKSQDTAVGIAFGYTFDWQTRRAPAP